MRRSHRNTYDSTVDALRSGGYLLQQHDDRGNDVFFIVPDGMPIDTTVAYQVVARPDVRAGNAGLLENGPQTWMITKMKGNGK